MIEEVAEVTIDEVETSEIIVRIETVIQDIVEAGTRVETRVETKTTGTKGPQEEKAGIETSKTKKAIGTIEMVEMTEMTEMTEMKGLKEITGTKGTIVVIEDLLEEKEMPISIEGLERTIELITNKNPIMRGNSKIGKKELSNSLKSKKSVQEMITST